VSGKNLARLSHALIRGNWAAIRALAEDEDVAREVRLFRTDFDFNGYWRLIPLGRGCHVMTEVMRTLERHTVGLLISASAGEAPASFRDEELRPVDLAREAASMWRELEFLIEIESVDEVYEAVVDFCDGPMAQRVEDPYESSYGPPSPGESKFVQSYRKMRLRLLQALKDQGGENGKRIGKTPGVGSQTPGTSL
jgi:hypothetical protein